MKLEVDFDFIRTAAPRQYWKRCKKARQPPHVARVFYMTCKKTGVASVALAQPLAYLDSAKLKIFRKILSLPKHACMAVTMESIEELQCRGGRLDL